MAPKKRALGRGLGALIPTEPATAPGTPSGADASGQAQESPGLRYAEVPIGSLEPNPRQPRQVFDEDALAELADSIAMIGLLQPVVVRAGAQGRWEIVAGERRWRAAQAAGLATIPVIVRQTADDDLLREALLENLHRADLNPLEEAAAYQQLLDDFGCTQEELAARVGRSRPQVSNTLRLLRLPPSVARRVAAGVISAGHARALLALDDDQAMERLAARIVAEGLSVRATEEIVALGGDEPARVRAKRPRSAASADLADLAARIGDALDTRVSVQAGRAKGRLLVEFASSEDLQRIASIIDGRSR